MAVHSLKAEPKNLHGFFSRDLSAVLIGITGYDTDVCSLSRGQKNLPFFDCQSGLKTKNRAS
jgi:hypothetical protein